jgi:hypothetical protein
MANWMTNPSWTSSVEIIFHICDTHLAMSAWPCAMSQIVMPPVLIIALHALLSVLVYEKPDNVLNKDYYLTHVDVM